MYVKPFSLLDSQAPNVCGSQLRVLVGR